MVKISQEDILLLWNDMQERSWLELEAILRFRFEDLNRSEEKELMDAVDMLKDEPFPESAIELFFILKREVNEQPQSIWINHL